MKDKTAIVTGAGKRVGAVLARELLADGWAVVAHVHHVDDEVPKGAVKVVADLLDPDCAEMIFDASEGLPPVRLLVNNAARFAWDGVGEFSAGEFDAHMAINVRAPALLIERFAAAQRDGDALVVNLLQAFSPQSRLSELHIVQICPCSADRACGAGACSALHPGQWDRSWLDAEIKRAERGELRGDARQ